MPWKIFDGTCGLDQERELRLAEHVDEARRDDLARRIDAPLRRGLVEPTDGGDAPGADADVRRVPRRAGAVDHPPMLDDDVVPVGPSRPGRARAPRHIGGAPRSSSTQQRARPHAARAARFVRSSRPLPAGPKARLHDLTVAAHPTGRELRPKSVSQFLHSSKNRSTLKDLRLHLERVSSLTGMVAARRWIHGYASAFDCLAHYFIRTRRHSGEAVFRHASSSERISFNLLRQKDGSRVKQQYVAVADGKLVERSEMVKGYEFAKDQYVMFSRGTEGARGHDDACDRHRAVRAAGIGRPRLLRRHLLSRAGQGRREALHPARDRIAKGQSSAPWALGVAGQGAHRRHPADR